MSYNNGIRLDDAGSESTGQVRACMTASGAFVVSWVELRDGGGESLAARAPAWASAVKIADERMIVSHASAAMPENRVMFLWSSKCGDGWPVKAAILEPDGKIRAGGTLTRESARAHNIAAVTEPDGSVLAAWEEHGAKQTRLVARSFTNGAWSAPAELEQEDASFYDPSPVPTKNGFILGFTTCRNGNYSAAIRAFENNEWGRLVPVSDSMRPAMRPSLATDPAGNVWIAYVTYSGKCFGDERHDYFVRHDRRRRQLEFWRFARDLRVAVWDGVAIEYPLCGGAYDLPVLPTTRFPNFPKIFFDSNGKPWVAYQVHQDVQVYNNKAQREMLYFTGSAWSAPIQNAAPNCLGESGPTAAGIDPAGRLWLAWQGETRMQAELPGPGRECPGIFARTVEVPSYPWGETRLVSMCRNPWKHPPADNPPMKGAVTVGGKTYNMFFGNLHCHTEISVCSRFKNGDFDLHYRHARDVMNADFGATTDHCYNSDAGHWRLSCKHADFYSIPGAFSAPPSFEWTDAPVANKGVGHLNVYHFDGEFLPPPKTPNTNQAEENYETLSRRYKGRMALAIPHHPPTSGFVVDWDRLEFGDFIPVIEIFQDMRGSCEGPGLPGQNYSPQTTDPKAYAIHNLLAGKIFGFICSSDHMGVAQAGLYAADNTLESLYEALKNRRCIGTTGAQVFIDFRADGLFIGETTRRDPADTRPKIIRASLKAAAPIRSITLVSQGRDILEVCPMRTEAAIEHEDTAWPQRLEECRIPGKPANLFYYLRVTLDDGEMAWTSPVFFTDPDL